MTNPFTNDPSISNTSSGGSNDPFKFDAPGISEDSLDWFIIADNFIYLTTLHLQPFIFNNEQKIDFIGSLYEDVSGRSIPVDTNATAEDQEFWIDVFKDRLRTAFVPNANITDDAAAQAAHEIATKEDREEVANAVVVKVVGEDPETGKPIIAGLDKDRSIATYNVDIVNFISEKLWTKRGRFFDDNFDFLELPDEESGDPNKAFDDWFTKMNEKFPPSAEVLAAQQAMQKQLSSFVSRRLFVYNRYIQNLIKQVDGLTRIIKSL